MTRRESRIEDLAALRLLGGLDFPWQLETMLDARRMTVTPADLNLCLCHGGGKTIAKLWRLIGGSGSSGWHGNPPPPDREKVEIITASS